MKVNNHRPLRPVLLLLLLLLSSNALAFICPACHKDRLAEISPNHYLCAHCLTTLNHKPASDQCICPHCVDHVAQKFLPVSPAAQNKCTATGLAASAVLLAVGNMQNSTLLSAIAPFPLLTAYLAPRAINIAARRSMDAYLIKQYQLHFSNPCAKKIELEQLEQNLTLTLIKKCSYLDPESGWREEFTQQIKASEPGAFHKGRALLAMMHTWNHDIHNAPSPKSPVYQYITPLVYSNNNQALPGQAQHYTQQFWNVNLSNIALETESEQNDIDAMLQHSEVKTWLDNVNKIDSHRRLFLKVAPDIILGIHTESEGIHMIYNPLTGIHRVDSRNLLAYVKGICDIQQVTTFGMQTIPTFDSSND